MERRDVDVLVVGSGAGGLATAVCCAHRNLSVIVAEKEPVFGGTTARSGGWSWIPCSAPARRAGVEDSVEKARIYLQHEAGEHFDATRVDAFLEAGPKAVDFYERETSLQFDLGPFFADYHPTAPGGMDGGRSIVARPFDGRELGDEIRRLRPPLQEITFLGMMIGSGKELLHFFNVTRSPISAFYVVKLFLKFLRDMALHGRPMRLMNGNALAGRLAKSAFDKNVPIWTSSPVRALIRDDDGGVLGAPHRPAGGADRGYRKEGRGPRRGGLPSGRDPPKGTHGARPLRPRACQPRPARQYRRRSRLGESAGANVDTSLPQPAALVPISRPVRPDGTLGTFPHFVDRSKPGVIAVTRSGRRFVNEAHSYHDFCQAMIKRCREEGGHDAENAAWFITDHRAFRKYGLGFAKPAPVPYGKLIKDGYLLRGETLSDLARQIGADANTLEATVECFNDDARKGEDEEFGKGSTSYNRSLGDPEHKPNPCLAPIETGPFYAVRLYVGDLGTFAGLRTNEYAQVLGENGAPIERLYAAGNDAASIMGGNYPGGGITLGPAITFGYIAARHMSGANE